MTANDPTLTTNNLVSDKLSFYSLQIVASKRHLHQHNPLQVTGLLIIALSIADENKKLCGLLQYRMTRVALLVVR